MSFLASSSDRNWIRILSPLSAHSQSLDFSGVMEIDFQMVLNRKSHPLIEWLFIDVRVKYLKKDSPLSFKAERSEIGIGPRDSLISLKLSLLIKVVFVMLQACLIQKKILLNHHILLQIVGLDSYQTIGGKCQQNDTQPDEDQS